MKRLLLLCLFVGPLFAAGKKEGHVIAPPDGARGGYFSFSPIATDAYRKAISLRFAEARAAIDNLKRTEPDNLIAPFIENYLDFITVFVNGKKEEYLRLAKNMAPRLAQIAAGDRQSPYYLFTQAEIRLQWAIIRGKFTDYLSSLNDIKQAYSLLEENQRAHPDFVANKKSLGILHAMIGSVPEEYKWSLKALAGIDGTVEQGLHELEDVLAYAKTNDFVFEEETLVGYSFLQLYLNNKEATAWQLLKTSKLDPRINPLAAFAMANMAMHTGRNDEAIHLLEEAPSGGVYYPFFYRQYLLGIAKLSRLDPDANKPLEAFINGFTGDDGIKEAYQKLAWYHLSQGNDHGYHTYMDYVKLKGKSRTEPDQAALREANSGDMPEERLLKARLLFDGGYYQRAFDLLKNAATAYTGDPKRNLEFVYRLGRITHEMGKTQDAIRYYSQTIEIGAKEPWYYACNAALQLGLLYEEQKNYAGARSAFDRCLTIEPPDYATGLHAQAKAGLNRLKGK